MIEICGQESGIGYVTTQIAVIGPPGDTPYIGDNENWWIAGTDTGCRALPGNPCNPNLLINGDFQVWQRGTSFEEKGYTADRWHSYYTHCAVEQIPNTSPGAARYAIKLSRNVEKGAVGIRQPLESYAALKGQTATVSFWMRGTSGNAFARFGDEVKTFPATVGWQRIHLTFQNLTFGSGADTQCVGIGMGNLEPGQYIELGMVKAELGETATAFPPRNYGEELALCQRYTAVYDGYQRFRAQVVTTNSIDFIIPFPATPRICPTLPEELKVVSMNLTEEYSGFTFAGKSRASGALVIRATKAGHGLTDGMLALPSGASIFDAEIY